MFYRVLSKCSDFTGLCKRLFRYLYKIIHIRFDLVFCIYFDEIVHTFILCYALDNKNRD